MSHPPICLRSVNERAVLESVLCVSYSHFGVTGGTTQECS